jgi:hypothetical protein
VIRDSTRPALAAWIDGATFVGEVLTSYGLSVDVVGTTEPGASVEVCARVAEASWTCDDITQSVTGAFRATLDLADGVATDVEVRAADASGNTATQAFSVTQATAPVPPPTPAALDAASAAAVGLGGVAAGAAAVAALQRRRRRAS